MNLTDKCQSFALSNLGRPRSFLCSLGLLAENGAVLLHLECGRGLTKFLRILTSEGISFFAPFFEGAAIEVVSCSDLRLRSYGMSQLTPEPWIVLVHKGIRRANMLRLQLREKTIAEISHVAPHLTT